MKKSGITIGTIVAVIAAILYMSQTFLGIDLIGIVDPDEEKPVIDTSSVITTLELNDTFNYDEVSCTDNRDFNCTFEVSGEVDTSTPGQYVITFRAEDLAGNKEAVSLLIEVLPDATNPVIDLTSIDSTLSIDDIFDTSGVTCTDNIDEACTVTVTGTVDTSTVGTYDITFTATDNAGNEVIIVMAIEVIDGFDTTIYVPVGYYNGIEGIQGEVLKNTLNDIITNHVEWPYTDKNQELEEWDVWTMLREADEDPNNPDNVILFYSGFSWPKECQDTNKSLLPDFCFVDNNRDNDYTEWNREHIWSKSHGDFEEEDGYAFEDTFGGYALGAHTDGHHLVAAERSMNSTKNNRFFDDCHDGINDDNVVDRGYGNFTCGDWYFEPRDEVKGDVARMIFYMAVRYEGEDDDFVDLEITNNLYTYEDIATAIKNSKLPYYENLSVLLRWHEEDPVDLWEVERNESIYQAQGNRNPFIDHPELVELIWGTPESPIEYESTTESHE